MTLTSRWQNGWSETTEKTDESWFRRILCHCSTANWIYKKYTYCTKNSQRIPCVAGFQSLPDPLIKLLCPKRMAIVATHSSSNDLIPRPDWVEEKSMRTNRRRHPFSSCRQFHFRWRAGLDWAQCSCHPPIGKMCFFCFICLMSMPVTLFGQRILEYLRSCFLFENMRLMMLVSGNAPWEHSNE
jgi:hypothetical protein